MIQNDVAKKKRFFSFKYCTVFRNSLSRYRLSNIFNRF